jgi:hypothetical protein
MASPGPRKEKEAIAGAAQKCQHPYVLWWHGSCLGCRSKPLPPRAARMAPNGYGAPVLVLGHLTSEKAPQAKFAEFCFETV